MAFVGALTFGFTQAVCPTPPLSVEGGQVNNGYLIINGWAYLLADWDGHPAAPNINASSNILYPPLNAGGYDASFLFQDKSLAPSCSNVLTPKDPSNVPEIYFPCRLFNPNQTVAPDPSTFTNTSGCHLSSTARTMYHQFLDNGVPNNKGSLTKAARVYFSWQNVSESSQLVAYNGDVLNLELLKSLPTNMWNIPANGLMSQMISTPEQYTGKDISHMIAANRDSSGRYKEEAMCLSSIIKVGSLDTLSIGCISSDIVLYVSLVVILGVIGTKFGMAVIFGWCLSWKLGNFKEGSSYAARMKREAEIENWAQNMSSTGPISKPRNQSMYFGNNNSSRRKSLFPQTSRFTQHRGGSTRFDTEKLPTPVWKTPTRQSTYFGNSTPQLRFFGESSPRRSSVSSDFNSGDSSSSGSSPCPFPLSPHVPRQPSPDYKPFNFTLAHTVCLVTCYSEGEESLRTTLDSIATSDYPNSHKILLVICDGIITGSGNSRSTPDICVSMMKDLIVPEHLVQPTHYVAIADGSRRNNMAKVYAGYYNYDDTTMDPSLQQRVPMVTIVKCGTPEEAATTKKPGNRGKRDSQIILMQFMQKVMFDERMTTMEYELFNSFWRTTGVTPDVYELCLMVDADTKLYPDALSRLISCAVKDPEISGMCGETKIANKTDSWVSMIQVFEYYISHHQSKAFESIFGIVTCLPGCFCMYRIKAPKGPDGYWVPILANPDIVEHYSENVVDTLHKKNLLLLGEDRYLSTLMLRTFPNRKMMFVPQAVCKTIVPDTFSVLLSQRRRWINSTIHNLMELLFVHELCGTFCFSMQFVLFMELAGTVSLPAAICFTIYLIIMAILGQPAVIPLILLALILGLPAVLIVMTSRKVVYICWMLVYLISLPIWNFVLPVYAYWHFDDFSWGDTRKVEGADKKLEAAGHGDKDGEFDSSIITMKKWADYEKDRRTQLALERNLPRPRFLERPRSAMDIFNITQQNHHHMMNKTPGSDGSGDSDTPLTNVMHQGDLSDQPLQLLHQQLPSSSFSSEFPQQHQQQQKPLKHSYLPTNTAHINNNNNIKMNAMDSSPSSTPLPHRAYKPMPPVSRQSEQQQPAPSLPTSSTRSPQHPWTSTESWADPAPHHQEKSQALSDRPAPPPPPP
ncbi:chitin synthase-domain-containing protein [Absidia repens]|uniref:chitin synthase n=1 Tax=Absidia repens TaxID=90262 RepID=A0A1X2J140_9FUNG|nr:chitin synthase-domain-containing protein [Absidia repens]